MKGYLLVLALLGLTSGAPQNWPYRDSLMPYRYGYPSQSQYKYLPQIEDDEDVGPYLGGLGRQDFAVVGSDGDRVRPTTESVVAGVVETGSVAPVVEPSKEPPKIPSVPSPPPPRPVGPEQGVGKPVQPPPFPPARPPPTPPPKEEEEDEDEDDDESDEADDEESGDDDNKEDTKDNEDEEEEEEEEERRRNEPLSDEKEVNPAVADQTGTVAIAAAPAPVVEEPVVPVTKSKEPEPTSVEEVNAPETSVESNEVVKPVETDDESEEEQGSDDSVEALVPGYVTDQGEVLVPVDTVTGDQPISIVPDPYTPPTRGVPINGGSNFRFSNYHNNPYYYSDVYEDELGLGRQDSEDEDDDDEQQVITDDNDENDTENEDEEDDDIPTEGPEGRNEFLTNFPPARTPELYAVINSRIPDSQEVGNYEQPFPGEFGPVVAYRVKQATAQQQRPSVSVAVALTQGSQTTQPQPQYIRNPYITQQFRNPYVSQQIRNPYIGQFIRRKPVRPPQIRRNPYAGPYGPSPYWKQQIRSPYPGHHMPSPYVNQYFPNAYINRFVNRPPVNPFEFQGPRPSQGVRSPGPRPIRRPVYPQPSPFGGYGPRPIYGPQGFTQAKPVFVKRRPGPKPVGLKTSTGNKVVVVTKTKKPQPLKSNVASASKRPTPVVYQDDYPYMFEDPQGYHHVSQSSSESNESSDYVQNLQVVPEAPPKTRRAAKMAKKETKKSKLMEKKKDADPLNILKKVSSKKA